MLLRYVLPVVAVLLVSATARAQHPEWTQYANTDYVTAVADGGDHLWIGTHGGLMRMMKETGERSIFTNANSLLPNNDIRSLAIDTRGDLWVGTRIGGVARFDGTSWSRIEGGDSPFGANYIHSIAADSVGNVWVAADGLGLAKYDGSVWTTYTKESAGIPLDRVFAIAVTKDGDLWGIMHEKQGAFHFDGTTWVQYPVGIDGMPSELVSIAALSNGDIWIGTGSCAAVRFEGANWRLYSLYSFLPDGVHFYAPVTCFFSMPDSSVIAGGSFGLARYRDTLWTLLPIPDSLRNYIPITIAGSSSDLWIGTASGAMHFDGVSLQRHATSSSGLPGNDVYELLEDRTGKLWAGAMSIITFDGVEWEKHNVTNGIRVTGLALDSAGSLWASAMDLHRFDGTKWDTYDTADHQLFRPVAITVGSDGVVWTGGIGGLSRFDGGTFTELTGDSKPALNQIVGLRFDREGRLWAADPFKGAEVFDGTMWSSYNTSVGLPSDQLSEIALDPVTGNIWIGTRDAGVIRFDGSSWTTFDAASGAVPQGPINALAISPNGTVWVGTPVGAARFDGTAWQHLTVLNSGLPDNNIQGLYAAPDNGLWVGTQYGGIARYTPLASGVGNHAANETNGVASVRLHPNPATASGAIHLESSVSARVRITMINALGEEVAELFDEVRDAGSYRIPIDLGSLPSGRYYLYATVGDVATHVPVVVLR